LAIPLLLGCEGKASIEMVVSLDYAIRVGDAFEGYKTGTITHTDPTDLTEIGGHACVCYELARFYL